VNAEPLRSSTEDLYPVERGQRFSVRIEFDRVLADDTDVALHFEALDGTDGFEIVERQRISLRAPEYRMHGTAQGEAGVYRLSRVTLNHPALTPRVYAAPTDVTLTIVDEPPSFPELVSAERYISRAELPRAS
jgi:hypothetical protein